MVKARRNLLFCAKDDVHLGLDPVFQFGELDAPIALQYDGALSKQRCLFWSVLRSGAVRVHCSGEKWSVLNKRKLDAKVLNPLECEQSSLIVR